MDTVFSWGCVLGIIITPTVSCTIARRMATGGQPLERLRRMLTAWARILLLSPRSLVAIAGTALPCAVENSLPTTNTNDVPAKANQLANFPLNFLRTGWYKSLEGKIYNRATHGFWWSATGTNEASANSLGTDATGYYPQHNNARGYGFAQRWVL